MSIVYDSHDSHFPLRTPEGKAGLLQLIALFKIRDYRCEDRVRRLTGVQFVSTVNSGQISDIHSLVTVQMKEDAQEFTVVDIGTILGLAHLIPEGELALDCQ